MNDAMAKLTNDEEMARKFVIDKMWEMFRADKSTDLTAKQAEELITVLEGHELQPIKENNLTGIKTYAVRLKMDDPALGEICKAMFRENSVEYLDEFQGMRLFKHLQDMAYKR
jgi:hypothetical protein